jgi:hypothetical protein
VGDCDELDDDFYFDHIPFDSPYEKAMLQVAINPVTRLVSTNGLTEAPLSCMPRAIIVTITAERILIKASIH